jgi:hypothetical protein
MNLEPGALPTMRMASSPSITGSSTPTPATESARRWIVAAAKLGYAAKALVYAAIGVMALLAAAHTGKQTTGTQGAFIAILSQPFGRALLGVVAVGLAAYALWRLVQAVMDADHRGSDIKGIAARVGVAFAGLVYAGLAYSALRLFLGLGRSDSDDQQVRSWTALLLAQPLGPWLVAAGGIVVIAMAIRELYVAVTADFATKLKLEEMGKRMRTFIVRCAQIGHLARSIVFAIIGAFLIEAALHSDAREARGLGGALRALEQQPYGDWLLAAVAVGFLAYAAYLVLLMIYRRILED